jgi:3-phosphoshikimate 1-carboxyvinyltransferase
MDVRISGGSVDGEVLPPPSKSYTHRAFFSATLSPSARVINPLLSLDTVSSLNACSFLGAYFRRENDEFYFRGIEEVRCTGYTFLGNSGTTLRMLLGICSLSPYLCTLDGDESLRSRPNRGLAMALRSVGGHVEGYDFKAPLKVRGIIKGGRIDISAESSQYITSLLHSLPLSDYDSEINVVSVKSRPYLDITLDVLRRSGIKVDVEEGRYYIQGGQRYRLREITIPSDFSSIGYLIAMGLVGGKVVIRNAIPSAQGDKVIVDICRRMGGEVKWDRSSMIITAEKSDLEGTNICAESFPDLVPVLATLSAYAKGRTVISGVEHLRIKEIDRVRGIVDNLRSLGVDCRVENGDGLRIVIDGKGSDFSFKGTVDSFGDHRMALAFSILGLVGEVEVKNANVVSVSYPDYFDVMGRLGAVVERKVARK